MTRAPANRLFLVEKSDCPRIEAVIAADYLYLSGINFGLENRRRGTQRLHDVFNVRFYRRLEIIFRCGFNRWLDGSD